MFLNIIYYVLFFLSSTRLYIYWMWISLLMIITALFLIYLSFKIPTSFGMMGGWTSLASNLAQSILLKNEWVFISSSSATNPSLLVGFFIRNWNIASLSLYPPVIISTDPLADILGLLAPYPGIAHLTAHDCGEKLLLVLSLERRMTCHHLVQHQSKRPPIDLWKWHCIAISQSLSSS